MQLINLANDANPSETWKKNNTCRVTGRLQDFLSITLFFITFWAAIFRPLYITRVKKWPRCAKKIARNSLVMQPHFLDVQIVACSNFVIKNRSFFTNTFTKRKYSVTLDL